MNTYIAYVYKDPASSFGVSFPDLPGCFGAGETYDEALENAKISLREYARAVAENGDDMPTPRTHGELAGDASELIEMDKAAFVAEVPLVTIGHKKRVNLSIDDRLLSAVDRACALAGVNRSALFATLASEWLEVNLNAVVECASKAARKKRSVKKQQVSRAAA